MRQSYELTIEQHQRLTLTPTLLQAINVLQLNAVQLESYVQEQMLSNPMLETDESRQEEAGPFSEGASPGENASVDWAEYARNMSFEPREYASPDDDDDPVREVGARSGLTLAEYICMELRFAKLREDILPTAMYTAGCLDEDGYLRISLEEISEHTGADAASVMEALLHVQAMDPPGVGARTLTECLSLQLIRRGMDTPLAMVLVKNHLEDIAANRISAIARAIGEPPLKVQEVCDIIKTLDPKPGRMFGRDGEAQYIVPDVYVERSGDGYSVSVNESLAPRLIISPYYRRLLESKDADPQLREFLEGRLNSAAWLIRSIQQRSQTIMRVTSAIMEVQKGFLDRSEGLKPLTLAAIAKVAGVHESTVSRCTAGKYVQTPRGIFELKYFFGGAVCADAGDVSSDSVKKFIGSYIQEEDGRHPLSDQAIAEKLAREKGVRISRRTVAKYRESMGIASSSGRKRF